MSKSVNLLDSLNVITSDRLLRNLVDKIAHDLVFDWDKTAGNIHERSAALFAALRAFQKHHPTQHCNLTTQLSTIALSNAAGSGVYLKAQISANPIKSMMIEKMLEVPTWGTL